MAVNVPTSIESITLGRVRPNRYGGTGRLRLSSGSSIQSRELVACVALGHLARSVQPRGWSFYTAAGLGTASTFYLTAVRTITTLPPASSATWDLIVRASGSGDVRVSITDGSSTDTATIATSGSEATYTDTLDVSGLIAGASCLVTVELQATTGTITLYGATTTPQPLTSSDIA